ncbi:hypothetical protein B5E60_12235 [Alistipes sp. An116]|uniref:Coenzyme F420 hydrogenase/dehydrogenase, beta subunit C-terminal domain n=1 Tax=Alistipes sp. An116 TaxID=1965546 RepID=UPI000B3A1362|nr:Coenzyme F420 hydrogenase/dehydrogenase, beta subunit C-terminal domain [Alistipes sp. An116]OUQ51589.1 hypothetical protein B5E60_12235 [Alistipes sp. An116]
MNITNIVSSENCCIGCGVCVFACPVNHLRIVKNEYNQLSVFENDNKCLEKCSICSSVCPFSNQAKDENTLSDRLFQSVHPNYCKDVGYYLGCYVGYHPLEQKRINCASGGLLSYLLEHLLAEGLIDTAVLAGRVNTPPFFSYQLCHSADDVYRYSRSVYSIININQAINAILKDDSIQKVAVVALPCTSKALRNAVQYSPMLKGKLKYIIGIVCGQQKSNNFIDYLASKNNVHKLSGVIFRTKKENRPNGNFGVQLFGTNGLEKEITFSSYAKECSYKLFTVPACNLCDDIFAETADIAFMDAWLPEYKNSDKGENLVVTRNKELDEIIAKIETVHPINIDRIVESQASVVKNKREGICESIICSKRKFKNTPLKRVGILSKPNFLEKYLYRIKYDISINSDRLWFESGRNYRQFNATFKKRYGNKLLIGLTLNKLNLIIKRLFK